ncbi:hypothetical protein HDU81_004703 [Chytriomyces hyalinus]|nr:hypothetical protein HDU81_004703 [Chytriomyces hyalinus]
MLARLFPRQINVAHKDGPGTESNATPQLPLVLVTVLLHGLAETEVQTLEQPSPHQSNAALKAGLGMESSVILQLGYQREATVLFLGLVGLEVPTLGPLYLHLTNAAQKVGPGMESNAIHQWFGLADLVAPMLVHKCLRQISVAQTDGFGMANSVLCQTLEAVYSVGMDPRLPQLTHAQKTILLNAAASADACPKDDMVECSKAGGVWASTGGCSLASSTKPTVDTQVTASPTYLPVSRTGVSTKTDGSLYNSSAFSQIPGVMVAASMLLAIF